MQQSPQEAEPAKAIHWLGSSALPSTAASQKAETSQGYDISQALLHHSAQQLMSNLDKAEAVTYSQLTSTSCCACPHSINHLACQY